MPLRLGVAPHAGAWIETASYFGNDVSQPVAPHAGAWIETPPESALHDCSNVAPHAGAWIETCVCFYLDTLAKGRSPCGSVD